MKYNYIINNIEDIIGENVDYNKLVNITDSSLAAEDLKESGIIEDTKTKFYRITFYYDEKNLAQCDYMLFTNENIGYISDVDIHKDIRGNGIGTKVRKYAIEDLNVDEIYSYPTNNIIKHICRKQDFEPSKVDKSWYVKR